jgi:hypothetical protein
MTMAKPDVTDPFGLLRPETWDDPYPTFARMRATEPIHFSEPWGGWMLTRYQDVLAGTRDPRLSSRRSSTYAQRLPPEVREKLAPLVRNLASWALVNDPPEHNRLRSLINKAFTPRQVERLRPRIQELVDELLDAVQGTGRMDVTAQLSNPLPVIVIGEMMGVPREDWPRLKVWSDALAMFIASGQVTQAYAEQALRAILDMEDYFRGVIAQRREHPGEDVLSSLVLAEEQGRLLDEQELLSTCAMLMFGGHETTTNLIGNGLHWLMRCPEQREALRADPDLIETAVEELVRYDSPVQWVGRLAREDFELEGKRIRAGDRVFLMIGAANRDPARFLEPDRLELRRQDNRHLGFGMGSHHCVGAALGRLEARIAIPTVLRRFPGLRPAEAAPVRLGTAGFRGFKSLPVLLS